MAELPEAPTARVLALGLLSLAKHIEHRLRAGSVRDVLVAVAGRDVTLKEELAVAAVWRVHIEQFRESAEELVNGEAHRLYRLTLGDQVAPKDTPDAVKGCSTKLPRGGGSSHD